MVERATAPAGKIGIIWKHASAVHPAGIELGFSRYVLLFQPGRIGPIFVAVPWRWGQVLEGAGHPVASLSPREVGVGGATAVGGGVGVDAGAAATEYAVPGGGKPRNVCAQHLGGPPVGFRIFRERNFQPGAGRIKRDFATHLSIVPHGRKRWVWAGRCRARWPDDRDEIKWSP